MSVRFAHRQAPIGRERGKVMKVTINVDCTPEEARTFMGLPDVAGAQQVVVDEWQRQALDAMSTMDPQTLFKAWMPGGSGSAGMPGTDVWEQFQQAFWSAMPDSGGQTKK
jgi:hypothetical protein